MTQKQMTPEIRYKIFANNIGCEVIGILHDEPCKGYLTGVTQQYGDYYAEIQWIKGYHAAEEADFRPVSEIALSLKPLSSISDEEYKRVIEICNDDYDVAMHEYSKKYSLIDFLDVAGIHPERQLEVFDFLRSKGYALPFMDYSVSDLVEAGVYKLQNS